MTFLLLEGFVLGAFRCWNGADEWATPLTSPTPIRSLELRRVVGGTYLIARRLLDLPGGPNFTRSYWGVSTKRILRRRRN